jgi:UDP-N-acetylmuramoyl-tripeptide--D-alanyl-D-alanine ligase
MKMTLEEISLALKSVGDLNGSEKLSVTSIQTDSRLVKPGDLFVCLCGEKMDGHNFADQAAKKGAAAVVSHHPMITSGTLVLLVEDTLRALGRLARYWRMKKGKRVIAITGSAGKTTTKEMLSNVLGLGHKVGKNYKNWNNQIGLPLSILKFSGEEDFWVLELGINNPSDMDELGEIACPDLAVILNIGPCHLQGLGTLEGVAKSKSKILDHLQGAKTAYVCTDYPLLEPEVKSRPEINPVWFSCMDNQASYNVKHLKSGHFQVMENKKCTTFESMPGGELYCENIGAVWAVARQQGMAPERIARGLTKFVSPAQRFSIKDMGSWTIIDDTYNANPLSMTRAVNSARVVAGSRNLFLVMGDMAELGHSEIRAHQDLGREISEVGCAGVFFHGKNAENVRAGLDNGNKKNFYEIRNPDHFKSILNRMNYPGGVVLFKGSRSQGMEKYLSCFREWYEKDDLEHGARGTEQYSTDN